MSRRTRQFAVWPAPTFRFDLPALVLGAAFLAGCAGEAPLRDALPLRPADIRAQIVGLIPAGTADRAGWAHDTYAALSALEITPTPANICAVLAVIEQESTYRTDPEVPRLGQIAWGEIDRRAERLGVPAAAVHLALKLPSSNGKSYAERIDAVKTEKELSRIFEDLIDRVPLGQRLFADRNPVRTGGPMQVAIAFAEQHAAERPYPYPVATDLRAEVFTRRGGLYFGIAHLLDYEADYPKALYRFADFNAGRYASRNAAFQAAVSGLTGIPLDTDGDLVRHGDASGRIGSTEIAVRTLWKELDMSDADIRKALDLDEGPAFADTALYRKVFSLADRKAGKAVPRAVVPKIVLKSPKFTRKLTTEWFATRVDERHRKCLARAAGMGGPAKG